MRMLSSALRRNTGNSSLQNLKKCLLYALAGHIAGNRYIFGLLGDLINLIDINNAVLCPAHIILSRLDQL